MKFRLLLLFLFVGVSVILAQSKYPLVSIHDIQYIDGVDTNGFVQSSLTDSTVRVRGVIMVRPVVDADTNRTSIVWAGSRWSTYIEDTTGQIWAGLNVLQNDTTGAFQATNFDLVDTSDIVEFTGVVTRYNDTNELMMLLDPVTPVNIVGKLPKRPDPIQVSISDFMSNGVYIKDGFKYGGMYVEFHNVISSDRNASNGQFRINDKNGDYVAVYSQSRYFKTDANKMPGSTYDPPQNGTPINYIRGILSFYGSSFEIIPLYPNDMKISLVPPTISDIMRGPVHVKTNEADTIFTTVSGNSGAVTNVMLHYKIGDQARDSVTMTQSTTDTSLYYTVISGIPTDSTVVDYFVTADDNVGLHSYFPSDTVNGNYFYQVLDGGLNIRDIQYSPLGSGYSSYNGYYVTLSGTVTADTSDIPGFYPPTGTATPRRVYMQDGSGPWTGIMIGTGGIYGADVLKLKRGDNVTVTGRIMESYGVTEIDSLTGSPIVSTQNNPLPQSITLTTDTIGKKFSGDVYAEQWESVLINYKNVTVTDENADGDPGPNAYNFGEIYVNDGTGDARVELQDGNHNYHNDWDSTLFDNPLNKYVSVGSYFSEIRGILFYSHGYYKLVPRQNDDFMGFVTGIKKQNKIQPSSYTLEQNYPNPFNPTTKINYSITKSNIVTLKIYNILGQLVRTLVNQRQARGAYTVTFNATNLSSGVYFYMLKAGNFTSVKKMILLK